jgi:hypothetical protein
MRVHYLVIWMVGNDMNTRKETPMDLELADYETDALDRYNTVKEILSDDYHVPRLSITIINICRL